MKKKHMTRSGLFILSMLFMLLFSFSTVYASEDGYSDEYSDEYSEDDYSDGEGDSEEPEIPESYYYPIESNAIPGWPQGPAIEAASAVVMDLDSGTFLYSKNMDAKQYPASITKIMTTLIALEKGNLDDVVTLSDYAVYSIEEGSSHIGLREGEKLTLRQLLYGVMLESANDGANGVAEHIAGTIRNFTDMMNEKAEELGCTGTHFSNVHGLHEEDHYTTAHDMALIAQAAYENEQFRRIIQTKTFQIPETNVVKEERGLVNHHGMLPGNDYAYEGCTGGKTGFTNDALNTLVTFAERDGRRLVCVILRVNGASKAYEETAQLLDYGFANFSVQDMPALEYKETYLDIMRMNYLGIAGELQPQELKEKIIEFVPGEAVLLPITADSSDIKTSIEYGKGSGAIVHYTYNDEEIGTASLNIKSLIPNPKFAYKKTVNVIQRADDRDPAEKIVDTASDIWKKTEKKLEKGYEVSSGFVTEHRREFAVGGLALIIILIPIALVLLIRGMLEKRTKRNRKNEEQERRRMAEEIDSKSVYEIEAELRAAMEQEQLRRQRKEAAKEAARQEEQKLTEAEQVLQEVERIERENKKNQENQETQKESEGEE